LSYLASKLTPTARLVLGFLAVKEAPQSAIDVSDAIGASYWAARVILKELVESGHLAQSMVGKSPHYSITIATIADPVTGGQQ
jgi:hypothetical protein